MGDIEDFQNRLIDGPLKDHKNAGVQVIKTLKLILHRAYLRGELEHDPGRGVMKVKVNKKGRTIYSENDIDKLFREDVWEDGDFFPWENETDYTCFITALCTGMRKGEVLALRWENVDLEKCYIRVKEAFKEQETDKVGLPKAKKARAVPIFDYVIWPDRRAVTALRNLKEKRKSKGCFSETIPVFGYADGKLRKGTWWNQHWKAALDRAEIDRNRESNTLQLDGHSFRHTLASHLKAKGLSDGLIRQFCGWSCGEVQSLYIHLEPELLKHLEDDLRVVASEMKKEGT
jgi:integrase